MIVLFFFLIYSTVERSQRRERMRIESDSIYHNTMMNLDKIKNDLSNFNRDVQKGTEKINRMNRHLDSVNLIMNRENAKIDRDLKHILNSTK
jgi:hypothetical protein